MRKMTLVAALCALLVSAAYSQNARQIALAGLSPSGVALFEVDSSGHLLSTGFGVRLAVGGGALGQVVAMGVDSTGVFHAIALNADGSLNIGSSGGGTPGGTSGQVQFDNAGVFGGFTVSGDGTLNTATGVLTITKTNGAAFATVATSGNYSDLNNAPTAVGAIGWPAALPSAGTAQLFFNYADVNQTPIMSSNTAPSGVASASSSFNAGQEWMVYDHSNTTGWITNGTVAGWTQYQFASAVIITSYAVTPWSLDNFPSRSPTAWTLQGSNNGSTFTTLDTETVLSSSWVQSVPTVFSIAHPASYAYYRMNITANGTNTYTGIDELLLRNSTGATVLGLYTRDVTGLTHLVANTY